MSSKILLLCVYFGPFPSWFPTFLISCRYNPKVEWLVISDNDAPPHAPDNVKFRKTNLDAFNRLVSQKLELDVRFTSENLYKLVDLKTALGKVFEEDTEGYDFWGHCDLDIIWGNIEGFIEPALLERFDIVTSRPGKISGHFCIYKNIPELRTLYACIPNFAEMIQNQTCCRITEPHFTAYLEKQRKAARFRRLTDWFTKTSTFSPTVFWDVMWSTPGREQKLVGDSWDQGLLWKQGRAFTIGGKEVMYLHFHELKKNISQCRVDYPDTPQEIAVTTSQILMR